MEKINRVEFERIINVCAHVFEVEPEAITQIENRTRKKNVVEARHTAMAVLHSFGYKNVAKMFELHRTTVYNSLKKFKEWTICDAVFGTKVLQVMAILND